MSRRSEEVSVVGSDNALAAVAAQLALQGMIAHQLRVEQPSLDDAFLAITEHQES